MPIPDRVMILRPGALGDVVLALPAVAELRRLWPHAQFTWIGYRRHLEWLEGTPYVDAMFAMDSSLLCHLFDGRADEPLDRFLSSHDFCVAWVQDREGVLARRLAACFGNQFILAPPFPPRGSQIHASDCLLDSLRTVIGQHNGVTPPPGSSHRYPRELSGATAQRATTGGCPYESLRSGDFVGAGPRACPGPDKWVGRAGAGALCSSGCYGVVHPGSGGRLKCWPLPRFQQAALALQSATGYRIVWLLGPAEGPLEVDVREFCARHDMPCLAGLPTRDIVGVLSGAAFYLGNDSGVTHLAAFLGTKTTAVFGPTSPAEWAPRGECVTVLRHEVPCSPCSDSEMRACPDRQCLQLVDIEQVVQAVMAGSILPVERQLHGH